MSRIDELKWYENQDWTGLSGAQAFQIIERHAEGWTEIDEAMAAWLKANQRPPVAGLAELTDAQLVELFDYIEVARGNAAQKHWASSETMQSWEARRKVVIAKAAREFLGKVDA